VFLYIATQGPSYPYYVLSTQYKSQYAFHGIDLFASFEQWNMWNEIDNGSNIYNMTQKDMEYGANIRKSMIQFILNNETIWLPFNNETGYVGLLSTITNNSEINYKQNVCDFYASYNIDKGFWWSD